MVRRRYGNSIEDINQCVAKVWSERWDGESPRQCSRKRGYGKDGLLCKQHAKAQESERGFVSIPDPRQIDEAESE